MTVSELVFHRNFQALVKAYHPYAEYEGYSECDDFEGFVVAYRGTGERQYMLVDSELDVVNDTTIGTTRWMAALGIGAIIADALFGDT